MLKVTHPCVCVCALLMVNSVLIVTTSRYLAEEATLHGGRGFALITQCYSFATRDQQVKINRPAAVVDSPNANHGRIDRVCFLWKGVAPLCAPAVRCRNSDDTC